MEYRVWNTIRSTTALNAEANDMQCITSLRMSIPAEGRLATVSTLRIRRYNPMREKAAFAQPYSPNSILGPAWGPFLGLLVLFSVRVLCL